jgi:hypothetical protein
VVAEWHSYSYLSPLILEPRRLELWPETGLQTRLVVPAVFRPSSDLGFLVRAGEWNQPSLPAWKISDALVAGDEAGDWRGWYRKAIPRAEQL